MTSPRLHRLPDLLDTAADILDHLGPVTGLRLGCHTSLPEGAPVRLLVKTGLPYTTEVGALDRIGVALGAPVTHQRASGADSG
ncbi:hypothetical protein [Streptomyces albus]|uniref:hypothetical protein n=1 Tax=Streptomyces albus TaxID=1888 RepID=UPI0024E1187D|nr:hypothetical protein [Streptomyces albus]GHJ19136.1 hypothetical protein TPA0909_07500 [Streptomyces albus]